MFVFRQTRFGGFVLTREARLASGATILEYRDKATVQVYSSRSTTGPSKVCAASIDNNAPAYSIIKEDLRYFHHRVVSEFEQNSILMQQSKATVRSMTC